MIDATCGQGIDVQHACLTLGVSPSGYYVWKDRPASPRQLRRIWLAGEIADVHKASGGTSGALRVTAELKPGRGIPPVDDGHHRAPHPGRQGQLLRRARRVLALHRRLDDRQHPDHHVALKRWGMAIRRRKLTTAWSYIPSTTVQGSLRGGIRTVDH